MSLSKQLLILISALFLMVFSLNFVLSVNNMRGYLEGEAQIHAQDTATSLGLSLSQYMLDETDPIIETTMNAIFDMGYYQEIKLVNVENKALVTLTNKRVFEGVPVWFVNLLSMQAAIAQSEISSGWNVSGTIYVSLNPGYAYHKLYALVTRSFYYSLAAFVFSVVLLLLILRITLSPLKKIDQMALTIASGKFITINSLPWTTEVRNVTASMNRMSQKIKDVVNNLNIKLELIGKKLQQDDLTGLNKKSSFVTDMKALFSVDSDIFIFMIKIDSLSDLAKELEHDFIDQFIKDFAQILITVAEENAHNDISVYRFLGAEFALLVRQATREQVEELAKALSLAFTELSEKYRKSDIAHIGITHFNPVGTTDSILFAANEAHEQALLIGENGYYIRKSDNQAKDISEWKKLVYQVVDSQSYKIDYIGQISHCQSGALLIEDAFSHAYDVNGDLIPMGTFFSIAEKFAKIVDFDKEVTEQVIKYIHTKKVTHSVAINISTRTIKNSDFRFWLLARLKKNQAIAPQLVFSFSAYAVIKEFDLYKEFIEFVHQLNVRVMIKRFESQSMTSNDVKELNPDFIRLSRDLGNGIAKDNRKKAFVETMQGIGELLDIIILAENVQSEEDYCCIKETGILGTSR